MGFICKYFGHKWRGCKCVRCGRIRNEGHDYRATDDPCVRVCSICGSRKETHIWEGSGCVKVCKTCGKTTGQHNWHYKDGQVVCGCGATKHKLYRSICDCPVMEYTCEICGQSGGTDDCREYGCDFLKTPCL